MNKKSNLNDNVAEDDILQQLESDLKTVLSYQKDKIRENIFYKPTVNIMYLYLPDASSKGSQIKSIAQVELFQNKVSITPFNTENKNQFKQLKNLLLLHLTPYGTIGEIENKIVIEWFQVSQNIKETQIKKLNLLRDSQIMEVRNKRMKYRKNIADIKDKNQKFYTEKELDNISQKYIKMINDMYAETSNQINK